MPGVPSMLGGGHPTVLARRWGVEAWPPAPLTDVRGSDSSVARPQ